MGGAQELGDIGARLDLRMREGTTFGPVKITLRAPGQQPVDLTGASVYGSVLRRPTDAEGLIDFQVGITNAAQGRFSFGLSSAQTALLVPAERRDSVVNLFWEMKLEDASGNVRSLFHGNVAIYLGATGVGP